MVNNIISFLKKKKKNDRYIGEAQPWTFPSGCPPVHPLQLGQRVRQVGAGYASGDVQRHARHSERHRPTGDGIGTVQRAPHHLRLRHEGTVLVDFIRTTQENERNGASCELASGRTVNGSFLGSFSPRETESGLQSKPARVPSMPFFFFCHFEYIYIYIYVGVISINVSTCAH